jgi:hypothetical protein
MYWYQREPTLKDILSDQIVMAVMAADRVAPQELEEILRRVKSSRARRATEAARPVLGRP